MILVTNTFESRRSPVRYDPQSRLISRVKPASSSLPLLRCRLLLHTKRTLIQLQIPNFQVSPIDPWARILSPLITSPYYLHFRIGDISSSSNFSTTLRQARGLHYNSPTTRRSCDEFRSGLYYEFIFKNSSHTDPQGCVARSSTKHSQARLHT